MNDDEIETLNMLIPMKEKFISEMNDPLENDLKGEVPQKVIDVRTTTGSRSRAGLQNK